MTPTQRAAAERLADEYAWKDVRVAALLRELAAEPPEKAELVAYADKIAFDSAMATGKGCDVWPGVAGDYEQRTGRKLIALHTAPPQRQPLTDDNLNAIWMQRDCLEAIKRGDILAQFRSAARDVERAHNIPDGRVG